MEKRIFIASDKSGYELKEAVKAHLIEQGYSVDDVGTQDVENPLPFFEAGQRGAEQIQSGKHERGILICGTGMGMSIVANKHKGVHGAACESVYAATKARAINDANVLCMGGWIIAPMLGIEMAEAFLNTGFTEGLEDWRAEKLKVAREVVHALEPKHFK